MRLDWSILIEVLIACGFFEGARQIGRRVVNRKEIRVDVAEKLQGMSIGFADKMIQRQEVALERADELEVKFHDLEEFVDGLLTWARSAKQLLEQNGISTAPIPIRRVH